MRPFDYHSVESEAEAISASEALERSEYVAGGTTLIDLVKLDVMQPKALVDVNKLPLDGIEETEEGGLQVGANVRNSDLAWDERVNKRYRALSQALLSGASPQLRNMATAAGNLMQRTRCPYFRDNYSACNKRQPDSGCAAIDGFNRSHAILGGSDACIATHPSDMCVAMAIFDARVIVKGPEGEREIPISEFHLLPGDTPHWEHALRKDELITSIVLPPAGQPSRSIYIKCRDRESYEFALASVAASASVQGGKIRDVRIAFGGVGSKPWRSPQAERELEGKQPSQSLFESAGESAMRDARPLRYNAFKIALAKNVLSRALESITA